MTRPEFDFEEHERQLSLRYEQLALFEAFDKLVDMALDGLITIEEAKDVWENDQLVIPTL